MVDRQQKDEQKNDGWAWRQYSTKRNYWPFIVVILLLSLLIHIASVVELGHVDHKVALPTNLNKPGTVKFKVVHDKTKKPPPPKKKKEVEPDMPDQIPKILETPQAPTARPEKADYAGTVNHQTDKETRVSEKKRREKAADAGNKGKPDAQPLAQQQPQKPTPPRPPRPPKPPAPKAPPEHDSKLKSTVGNLAMDSLKRPKPRNDYEALLPSSPADLPGQVNAGYQDYVDDKVQEGDRIDINTSEYRYIGYFTSMRKAIELVWNYPMEAARKGEQGEVGLEFTIAKDGRVGNVRVIRSSGYAVLDHAIVDAIQAAAPFAPLPDGFHKDRLVITGAFRYILNSF